MCDAMLIPAQSDKIPKSVVKFAIILSWGPAQQGELNCTQAERLLEE